MPMITLTQPKTFLHWLSVYRLYRQAFPVQERKPFAVIGSMYRRGKTDLWCIFSRGKLAGFASTVNAPSLILLDYFAVNEKYRQAGIGTAALAQLLKHYAGQGLFVEIEDPDIPGADQAARQRRKAFYLRCGMEPLHVTADVFGVKMELLGKNCRLDFEAYQRFYRDYYSPWAAEHIRPPAQ